MVGWLKVWLPPRGAPALQGSDRLRGSGVPSMECLWHQTCRPFGMRGYVFPQPHSLSPSCQRSVLQWPSTQLENLTRRTWIDLQIVPVPPPLRILLWPVSQTGSRGHTHSPVSPCRPRPEPLSWVPPTHRPHSLFPISSGPANLHHQLDPQAWISSSPLPLAGPGFFFPWRLPECLAHSQHLIDVSWVKGQNNHHAF